MAEEKKSFLDSVKGFFANLWSKVKAIKWKELWHEGCTRIVKPVIAYSVAGGALLVAILIGVLCI